MADFFASPSLAPVASKAQEVKTAPLPPTDNAESTTITKGAGSNFSMYEIIM